MSHSNCIFGMGKYYTDETTICDICQEAGTGGDAYWFRGQIHTICDKHNIYSELTEDLTNERQMRLCPGICPDGSEKCIWPLSRDASAESIISD